MRPVALVLACALARAAGVTWLHHSSQDEAAGVLPTDGGGGPWAFQQPAQHPDELAAAAVDQAYMADRARAQKLADAEEAAGALADIATRSAAKAVSDAGWAAMAAQTTEAAVRATEAAQKAQEALAARAAEKVQMAAQVAQAAVAHREDRIHLERSRLELQAQQKAQLALEAAAAAAAHREERMRLERSDPGAQTADQTAQATDQNAQTTAAQKAQVAAQVAQAALAARAERTRREQSRLELQAAIAQDNLRREQKVRAGLAAQAAQKAAGDTVRPQDRSAGGAAERPLYSYTRHVLTAEESGEGVCLDGSPPGFYYSPAPAGSAHNNSWVLYLQGGAWCTDKEACLVRSKTELGSSTGWNETLPKTAMKSWLSSDPTVSQFHDFHKAVLMYCDGASFSGHVDRPVAVGGEKIYLRGRQVLTALIKAISRLGLGAPEQEVLLSGGSAGGLAAILQGDRVRAMLPLATKFKVRLRLRLRTNPNPNPNPNRTRTRTLTLTLTLTRCSRR